MMGATVREISPQDPRAVGEFILLERRLVGHYPIFVSNFDADLRRYITGRSAFTGDAEIGLWVASVDHRDVARCAALINPRFQAEKNEKVGFIGYFAAAPECQPAVSNMLDCAQSWLKERGIRRVIAPFNGSALLGMGFLIDDFDKEPIIGFGWNPPHYPEYLTQAGFQPTYPLLVYTIDFSAPQFRSAAQQLTERKDIRMRPINKRRWESDLELFRKLINANFTGEWEWHAHSFAEFTEWFSPMKPILDPYLMQIAEVSGKPAGVCIGLPDWNPALRGFKGHLGIKEQVQALLMARRYQQGSLVFAAVDPAYRGKGIGRMLEVSVCLRYEQVGLKKAFGYTVNADNFQSRKVLESLGATGRLLYQAYDRLLA